MEAMSMVNGYKDYITRAGDTFDLIAIAAYDEEKMASYIIQANPIHMDTLIFGSGTKLKIPVLDKKETPSTLPPWRR